MRTRLNQQRERAKKELAKSPFCYRNGSVDYYSQLFIPHPSSVLIYIIFPQSSASSKESPYLAIASAWLRHSDRAWSAPVYGNGGEHDITGFNSEWQVYGFSIFPKKEEKTSFENFPFDLFTSLMDFGIRAKENTKSRFVKRKSVLRSCSCCVCVL